MRDPKETFTDAGLAEFNARLFLLKDTIHYFFDQEDDLWLEESVISAMADLEDELNVMERTIKEGRFDGD